MNFAEYIISFIEIFGTIAFSLSGAFLGIERGLDFFGVLVLGTTTAVGGGILRDIVLNITPPAAFTDSTFVFVAAVSAAVAIMLARRFKKFLEDTKSYSRLMVLIGIFDAMGLGIFTVIGMNTAISAGFASNEFLVIFIGVMTGVGGGVLRDVLVHRTPIILKRNIYATASVAGGLVYYYCYPTLSRIPAMLIAAGVIVIIRFLAMYYDINLPKFEKK